MLIVRNNITIEELEKMSQEIFGDMVKAVVDIEREIMVVGGELHADEERFLLEDGSKQENLWGINIYPAMQGDDLIEFDSMINLRPSQGNRVRGVEDSLTRETIIKVINKLVKK